MLEIKRISATPDPAAASASSSVSSSSLRGESPEYAKLVDISRCIGCKGCEVACKEWNELGVEPTENFGSIQSHEDLSPNTWLLMRFNEVETGAGDRATGAGDRATGAGGAGAGEIEWLIKKDACLHCEEPGCLYACPAPGAIIQYENGIVDFVHENCIGCRYCVTGCPFDIPRYSPETKKVYKCNMCIDRVEAGLEPACVKTCPTNAISWGSKGDMVALAARKVERLRERGYEHATVYDPPGVGGVHMMYVVPLGDRLADYDLPENPTASPGPAQVLGAFKQLGAWAFGFGLLATALHYLGVGPESPDEAAAPTPGPPEPGPPEAAA